MARTQDYGLGEFTFPRGWFMVADAEELKERPLPLRFFGQEFALYRGKSGKVVMLDAYCPHMGTHLARNNTSYIVQDGQVEMETAGASGWVRGKDGEYRVRRDAGGVWHCLCPWIARHGTSRGPCKHILAVRIACGEAGDAG